VKQAKKKALKAAGWRVGSADEFLELSKEESKEVTGRVDAQHSLSIPEGWTLEPLPRQADYMLLTTSGPVRYMATIDFDRRGIRSGYCTIGRYVGEEWNKPRKKYTGRGWKQQLVDDAIAHLREVL